MDKETKDIHDLAMKRFDSVYNKDRDQRELAVEDIRFAHAEDGQWSEDATEKRGDRPRYTFNRVIGVIKQITGDHKQNRSQIKVSPDGDNAEDKTADIFSGIIRKIEKQSKAQNAYDNSFDEKTAGGYGGWRILTEFRDDSFNQDIFIRPIISACTSHYIDPASIEPDGSDSMWQFLSSDMNEDDFKEKYPEATTEDFGKDIYNTGYCKGWFQDKVIRVAEYWVKTPVKKTIALLSDGRVIDVDDESDVIDELAAEGITVVKTRVADSHKVQMYKMNGAEILEGPSDWAGKHIPLVPDYGETISVDRKKYIRGIVRFAKDSNRTYNFARSTDIETYALTPKDPYWYTPKQVLGHEDKYRNFNVKNSPFMPYNSDPAAPGPPARTGAPAVSAAGSEISRQCIDDMHATTSMYPPAMGNAPQLLSEKSVKSQAEKGDISSYIYQDNHEKALAFTGEILVDLIPKIIDTAQMIQILGIDGKSEMVEVNTKQLDQINQVVMDEDTGKPVIVNDLSVGKYGVSVETGPAFSTQRDESAQQLIQLAAASPVFEQLTPDLIAKNLNIVESEEFVRRIRKWAIQQGIAEPTEDEVQELGLDKQQVDPDKQALTDNVLMQTEKSKSDIELNDAKADETRVKTQSEAVSAYNEMLTGLQKQVDMGIPVAAQQITVLTTLLDNVQATQTLTQGDQPNSEQQQDLARMLAAGEIAPQDLNI